MLGDLLKSKLFIVFGGVAALLFAAFLGREIYRKYEIESEIRDLQVEIDKVNRGNSDLSSLVAYFNSPEFKERQARELLGLQKPGEFAVALPQDAAAAAPDGKQPDSIQANNFEKWWQFFFGSLRNTN